MVLSVTRSKFLLVRSMLFALAAMFMMFAPKASHAEALICGYVYGDTNANGVLDTAEYGVRQSSVTVQLKDTNGNVYTTQTDNGGFFVFNNAGLGNVIFQPATYTLCVVAPTGCYVSGAYVDDPSASAPNTAPAGKAGSVVTSTGNAVISGINFDGQSAYDNYAFVIAKGTPPQPKGSISGVVNNCNNTSMVFPGITVTLKQNGATVTTTTTDSAGKYGFPNIPAGAYTVCVPDTITSGGFSYGISGSASANVTVTANSTVSQNFCYQAKLADVIGTIANCTNPSGIKYAGITVSLSFNGNVVATTTSNSNGFYRFANVPVVTYTVSVPSVVSLNGVTLGICGSASAPITAGWGYQNFYYQPVCNVIGTCADAYNPSGKKYAGVTMTLKQNGNVVGTCVTDSNGQYKFQYVPCGTYTVVAPTSCQSSGRTICLTCASSYTFTCGAGGNIQNFFYRCQ